MIWLDWIILAAAAKTVYVSGLHCRHAYRHHLNLRTLCVQLHLTEFLINLFCVNGKIHFP